MVGFNTHTHTHTHSLKQPYKHPNLILAKAWKKFKTHILDKTILSLLS